MNRRALISFAVLASLAGYAAAQVPYLFTYNPGPTRGSKWIAQASPGEQEASAAVLMGAPRSVWVRLCYMTGPSDSVVTLYATTANKPAQSTQVAWGGCADVFGDQIWVGNPNAQLVGGYYGVAPSTPQ